MNRSQVHEEENNSVCPEAYRSILLLNVDYKPFMAMLVKGLNGFLIELIHPGEIGFIPKGHMKDNINYILNVIKINQKEQKLALFFLMLKKPMTI